MTMDQYPPGSSPHETSVAGEVTGGGRGKPGKPSLTTQGSRSTGPAAPEPLAPEDDPLVLDEIDRIIAELQTKRGASVTEADPMPGTAPSSGGTRALGGRDAHGAAPSGYFEEHLEAARRAVGDVDEKVEELQKTSALLRQRVASAETELGRISREYQFLQDRLNAAPSTGNAGGTAAPWSEDDPAPPSPLRASRSSAISSGSFTAIQAASADGPAPVYESFTVDRYNRTIDSLKDRRTKLVAWTLLLSAVIGIVLVLVVLYSPVVNPPIWVAVLPLVWVVPIPYFVLSFRGSHRVLQRNHLNLPEAK